MAGIWPLLSDDYFLLEPNPPFSEQEEEAIVALQNHSLEEVRASLGIEASTRWEQLRKSALKLKFESAAQNLLEIEQPYNDWAREIFNASGEILEDQEKRLEAYLALSQNPTN